VKGSPLASRCHALICSFCEAGELFFLGDDSARCTTCGGHLSGALLETLWASKLAIAAIQRRAACPTGCFTGPLVAWRSFLHKAAL
jgi:hypothetical protein